MVLITVGLGLICVLLLVFIILLHITITAERDLIKSYKNTVEEFNQTINSLQNNYTDLTQKKLKLEIRVNNLTAEKSLLQRSFESLNQKNLELESKVTSLSDELKKEESKQSQYKFGFVLFLYISLSSCIEFIIINCVLVGKSVWSSLPVPVQQYSELV